MQPGTRLLTRLLLSNRVQAASSHSLTLCLPNQAPQNSCGKSLTSAVSCRCTPSRLKAMRRRSARAFTPC